MYDILPAYERGAKKCQEYIQICPIETFTSGEFQALGKFYARQFFKQEKAQNRFRLGWYQWSKQFFYLMKHDVQYKEGESKQ